MGKLLVIGGSGFFGKSILDSYNRGLLHPWNIDGIKVFSRNAEMLSASNPELVSKSVELINGDISNCKKIPDAEYVIHAAASTDASRYIERPNIEKANILSGTHNYCLLAQKFHKNSKILYVSSGAVYGKQPREIGYMDEEFNPGPLELLTKEKQDYAAAKRDAEKAIRNLGKMGMKVSIARCFAFVGRYLPRDQHFAIGNFIQNGLDRIPIVVKADKMVFRSYMYSDDLVEWLLTIAKSANSTCPIYNVGSDEAVSLAELSRRLGVAFNVSTLESPITCDQVDRYIPLIVKAKRILNLNCRWNLNDAINETIKRINNEKTN
jgi:nucleoside-diphosphate-sugar epimerase